MIWCMLCQTCRVYVLLRIGMPFLPSLEIAISLFIIEMLDEPDDVEVYIPVFVVLFLQVLNYACDKAVSHIFEMVEET